MSVVPKRIGALETRARELNIPVNVLFELTHRCNLKCFHCYVDHDRRPELTTAEVKGILDQLAQAGSLFVTFTGGEIMLRRDLMEIVEHARSLRFAVRLFTNGTRIDEAAADRIAQLSPVDVSISIYGASALTHEKVTLVPGSFERATSALRLLNERGVSTRLKCVLMDENIEERVAIGELADELGASALFDPQLTPKNDGDTSALSHRLDDETLRMIVHSDDTRGVVGAEDVALCSAGRDAVNISPSGEVHPCLQMPMVLGDLRTQSFEEIWRGPQSTEMRTYTLKRMQGCSTCTDVAYCNPCLGLNLIETGDATRPSSSVCRVAHARGGGVMA